MSVDIQNDAVIVSLDPPLVNYTEKLGQFTYHPENRPIDPDHVRALARWISEENLLREFPIVVLSDGTVFDGQHRLEVAKLLGIGIWYIVSDTVNSIDAVAKVQAAGKAWTMQDYLHRYCEAGNANYIKLAKFVEKYPFMPISIAMSATSLRNGKAKGFKLGTYKADDMEFANLFAGNVLDFKDLIPHWKQTCFQKAMKSLTSNRLYDHSKMMKKMMHNSSRLVKCASIGDYLSVIGGIYNWKVRPDNIVVFRELKTNDPDYRIDLKK